MRAVTVGVPPVGASVPGVGWPALPVGRAATLANLLYELDRTQWVPPETVVAAQYDQLRVLARALAPTIPAFRDRLDRAGLAPDDLGTPEGLRRLPPLTRDELVAAGPAGFAASVPPGHDPIVAAKTSGSTGAPVTVRRTEVTGLLWDALTIRDHLWRGIDFQQRVLANRFGVKAPVARDDWGPPVSALYASAPLEALPLLGPLETLAQRCLEFGAEVLVVYPSVLDALLAHFTDAGGRPPRLRYVHTYAEPLPPTLRSEVAALLDVTVWNTYSCEEIGNISASCPDGDAYHVFAESVLVEVLDDDDQPCPEGAIGRVVVTDLHNLATPLVRYEVGDYAEVVPPCGCGRGLPTLGRVVGRAEQRARRPDGTWIWPNSVPLRRYRELAPVDQVQLVQRSDGGVDVVGMIARPPDAAVEDALTGLVHAALGHPFPLRFVWREAPIPRTRGGKFAPFRSEVAAGT